MESYIQPHPYPIVDIDQIYNLCYNVSYDRDEEERSPSVLVREGSH